MSAGDPRKGVWRPMQEHPLNPELLEALRYARQVAREEGNPAGDEPLPTRGFSNDHYQCVLREWPDGYTHLSIKRHDRMAARDWRHMMQIKNEVVGPEREAVELFPAESRLVDTANEYHLWVLPEGERFPFGYSSRSVFTQEQAKHFNEGREAGHHKGRQRLLQPGLTTGRRDDE